MAEIQFRDGPREVPPHVEVLLTSVPVHKLTYEQAMKQANDKLLIDHLERAHAGVLKDHFRRGGA